MASLVTVEVLNAGINLATAAVLSYASSQLREIKGDTKEMKEGRRERRR